MSSFILSSPYFRDVDRVTAHLLVRMNSRPIVRKSSIPNRYAITYMYNGAVTHSLLRAYPTGKIDIINEAETEHRRYDSFDDLMEIIHSSSILSVPAAAPTTPDPSNSPLSTQSS